jgi:cytochrome c peroxidase
MIRLSQRSGHFALAILLGMMTAAGLRSLHGALAASPTLGIPPLVPPSDNPITAPKVALGRKLFFDKRLSFDNTISCSTCHDPNYGFADPHPVSVGVKGRSGERNSHTLLNVAFMTPLMWDGRAATLEEQSLLPFLSPSEFDLPPDEAALKLRKQGYSEQFKEVFGEDVTPANIAKALATYERTLSVGGSPFDRYLFDKDSAAISPEARRGFDVFLEAKCDACHLIMTAGLHPFALKHVLFTDGKFHNLGVDAAKSNPDPGRYDVTLDPEDWGRFRTPTLRNVAVTAPYFHDGSAPTLADVVELYDKGGNANRNLDPGLRPLKLKPEQKLDLVRFLESLTASDIARTYAQGGVPEKH